MGLCHRLVHSASQKSGGAIDWSRWQQCYVVASRDEKTALLNELARLTGYNRKSLVRRLRPGFTVRLEGQRGRPAAYGSGLGEVVDVIWRAAGQPGVSRLQPFLVDLYDHLARLGELPADPHTRQLLATASLATLTRLLASNRSRIGERDQARDAWPLKTRGGSPPPDLVGREGEWGPWLSQPSATACAAGGSCS
jgi:hypothetical protein